MVDGAGCAGAGFVACATTKAGFAAFDARREEIVLMTRLEIANLLSPLAGAAAVTSRLRTRSETPPARLRKAPLPTSCDSGIILMGSFDTNTDQLGADWAAHIDARAAIAGRDLECAVCRDPAALLEGIGEELGHLARRADVDDGHVGVLVGL